ELVLADACLPPFAQLLQWRVRVDGDRARLDRVAQRLRDRVPGPIADLKQPLRRRAAAAGEAIAAVLAGELDPELLEPVNGGGGVAGERRDELHVRRLVAR